MSNIIDRRLNPRDKSLKNRQRFINIHRKEIGKAVKKIVDDETIGDITGKKSKVRVKTTSEPHFTNDPKKGDKNRVYPGNEDFVVGDMVDKPPSGQGSSGSQGGNKPGGEDEFDFVLTEEEFLDFVFDDMELPDMVKKQIKEVEKYEFRRAGYKQHGTPNQIDIVRSLKNSIGRRIGLRRPTDEEIFDLEKQIEEADNDLVQLLSMKLDQLKQRRLNIPWIDPFDVRYRAYSKTPKPSTKAVMFCVMDVSASMGETEKEIAKRFFLLLYLFLKRKYAKIDVMFIAHHATAKEVDEKEFFYGQETGGTIVSTAIQLTNEIIKERYNVADWNIYVAQASDGDNFPTDRDNLQEQIDILIPLVQYIAYVEIKDPDRYNMYSPPVQASDLWTQYTKISEDVSKFNMRIITDKQSVWKVFTHLFSKERSKESI
jgi:uncharacterized sporulation protein YeaH/YhbH (DUF444 family)